MLDYKKLNFQCGIEIHKQLESHKLFCKCPTVIDNSTPNLKIRRRLKSVAGEIGEKDIAMLYEESKNKEFVYEFSNDYACLTCLDEEPPQNINQEALDIALEISLLLNAKVVPMIIIMRKVILDGSNVASFQRSALIAEDGEINTSKGKIKIPTILLEEDSARKVGEDKDSVIYRLDRLGFPLVEISTAPDIKDGEHAKEVATLIGMTLRSTGRTKRGIGTIRQDINLSINKGARVELKGFQDLKNMPSVIDNEIKRQLSLINKGEKVKEEVRKVNFDNTTSFLRPMPGASRMYPETDVSPIKIDSSIFKGIVLPELISEKISKLEKKFNLRKTVAQEVLENNIELENLSKRYKNLEPKLIADVLLEIPKEVKARFNLKPKYEFLEKALENLNNGKISKDAIVDILVAHCKNEEVDFNSFKKVSDKEIEIEIKKIINDNKELNANAVMGIIMKKYRGKVDGKKIFEIIKKLTS
ncbi:Glu-tRNA(Gln) amidotransferase subunit GatE [Candidatus Woesearchaeota archaeon]|nr:Glu-tRNA(Gln) amidotransferase subunit GatE [Candidatus Woesearchaeota archaeon]